MVQGAIAVKANVAKQIAAEAIQEKRLQKTDPFPIQDKLSAVQKRLKATIDKSVKSQAF